MDKIKKKVNFFLELFHPIDEVLDRLIPVACGFGVLYYVVHIIIWVRHG